MDFTKIYEVASFIKQASEKDLKNRDLIANLIKKWGLHNDPAVDFGVENECFRTNLGMLQQPEQLSEALVYLSNFDIKTYCEIGTFWGSTCTFISLYLSRFNPELKVTGVDNFHDFDKSLVELINSRTPMEFKKGTSGDLKGEEFDLCFIDADHTYEGVKADYENVGKYAKVCMFHDINDERTVKERDGSGSVKFWNEIKDKNSYEFKFHPDAKNIMGIGIKCQSQS